MFTQADLNSLISDCEIPCERCESKGYIEHSYLDGRDDCYYFNGTGYVLSETGERLMDFIGRTIRRCKLHDIWF